MADEPQDVDERAYREAAAAPPTEQFAPVELDDDEFEGDIEDEPPRGRIRRWFSRRQSE